jgi:hypothetical protein
MGRAQDPRRIELLKPELLAAARDGSLAAINLVWGLRPGWFRLPSSSFSVDGAPDVQARGPELCPARALV